MDVSFRAGEQLTKEDVLWRIPGVYIIQAPNWNSMLSENHHTHITISITWTKSGVTEREKRLLRDRISSLMR